jgi:NADPH:quinone reductase-like Zn-dependent oxidoreductase
MDLAQNVFEGLVFGASDSENKLEFLRDANVLSTFNWTDGKLVKNVHKNTFGKGVDYVIDTVGGDLFQQGISWFVFRSCKVARANLTGTGKRYCKPNSGFFVSIFRQIQTRFWVCEEFFNF